MLGSVAGGRCGGGRYGCAGLPSCRFLHPLKVGWSVSQDVAEIGSRYGVPGVLVRGEVASVIYLTVAEGRAGAGLTLRQILDGTGGDWSVGAIGPLLVARKRTSGCPARSRCL